MNEEYLRDLHNHLGISADYETWVSSVQGNDEYLTNLHGHLGVNADFDTWMGSVWGVKKKDVSTESASAGVEESAGSASTTEPPVDSVLDSFLPDLSYDFQREDKEKAKVGLGIRAGFDLDDYANGLSSNFMEYSSKLRDPNNPELQRKIDGYKAENPLLGGAALEDSRKSQKEGIDEMKKNFYQTREQDYFKDAKQDILSKLTEEQREDVSLLKDITDVFWNDYNLDLDLDGNGRYNEQWLVSDMWKSLDASLVDLDASFMPYLEATLSPGWWNGSKSWGDIRRESYEEYSDLAQEKREGLTQYSPTSEGISNAWGNGMYYNAVRQFASSLTEQLPQIGMSVALAPIGGPALPSVLFGITGAAGYYQQTELEDIRAIEEGRVPLYKNNLQRFGGSATAGLGEAAFTWVGLNGTKMTTKLFGKEWAEGWLIGVGLEPTFEGVEEVVSELSIIGYEASVGSKQYTSEEVTSRLLDAYLLGHGAGTVFSGSRRLKGNLKENWKIKPNRSITDRANTAANADIEQAAYQKEIENSGLDQDGANTPEWMSPYVTDVMDKLSQQYQDRVGFFQMLTVRYPEDMDAIQQLDAEIKGYSILLEKQTSEPESSTDAGKRSQELRKKALEAKVEELVGARQEIIDKHEGENRELFPEEVEAVENSEFKSQINSLLTQLQILTEEINQNRDNGGSQVELDRLLAERDALEEHLDEISVLTETVIGKSPEEFGGSDVILVERKPRDKKKDKKDDNAKADAKAKPSDNESLFLDAVDFIKKTGKTTATALQKEFKIDFETARSFIERMAEAGMLELSDTSAPHKLINKDVDFTADKSESATYAENLKNAKESDPETYWSVDEVTAEDASGYTVIEDADGGVAVKPDGDIVGLYKKPDSKKKGVGKDLLDKAVEAGGVKLDNFDGYLTKIYEDAGFRVVSRVPFNEEFAPDGWDKEKHGTPDVVAMVYDPEGKLDIEEKTFDDYDEAMSHRDDVLNSLKADTDTDVDTDIDTKAETEAEQDVDTEAPKSQREQLKELIKKGPKPVPMPEGDIAPELQRNAADGLFVKYEGKNPFKKFANKMEKLRREWFSSLGLDTKTTRTFREIMEGRIGAMMTGVEANIRKFNKLYSQYKGDKTELLNDYDAALRGDKEALRRLPTDFAFHVTTLRNEIDGMSQALLDSGYYDLSTPEGRKAYDEVKKNMGQYLHRSFDVFDTKNWAGKVSDRVVNQAKNYIRSEITDAVRKEYDNREPGTEGLTFEEYLDNRVAGVVNSYLTKGEVDAAFGKTSLVSPKDLKKKKDIPEPLLALMGEINDPMKNYAESMFELVSSVEQTNAMNALAEEGLGKIFFKTKQGQFSQPIAESGPLAGLYTTPELAKAMQEMDTTQSEMGKIWKKWLGTIKWGKTIGSPATHAKNVVGNLGFMVANGHTDITQFQTAYTALKDRFSSEEELRAAYAYYQELGLVGQSATLGDIKSMFKDNTLDDAMISRSSVKSNTTMGEKVVDKGKKAKKYAENVYQAEDDFFKIVAFENERNRYSQALYGKPVNELAPNQLDALDQHVSELIKNTYPTYSRVPKAVQAVGKNYVLGGFISFQAESYRVAFNSLALATKESKSDNPEIRKIGRKRMLGIMSYMGIRETALSTSLYMAGMGLSGLAGKLLNEDEEEERQAAMNYFLPEWSKNSAIIVLGQEDGVITYIDATASDPYGQIHKNFNTLIQGGLSPESFGNALLESVAPFIGLEPGSQVALSLASNKDQHGNEIWNPDASIESQTKSITSFIMNAVEPGVVPFAEDLYEGYTEDELSIELIGLTGFKPRKLDISKQFHFASRDFAESVSNIRKIKYREGLDEANKQMESLVMEYHEIVKAARALGLEDYQIYEKLTNQQGIGKNLAYQVLLGEYVRMYE